MPKNLHDMVTYEISFIESETFPAVLSWIRKSSNCVSETSIEIQEFLTNIQGRKTILLSTIMTDEQSQLAFYDGALLR